MEWIALSLDHCWWKVEDAPVGLTGRFPAADSVALLVKAGRTRLSTGKAGISGSWRFELKGW